MGGVPRGRPQTWRGGNIPHSREPEENRNSGRQCGDKGRKRGRRPGWPGSGGESMDLKKQGITRMAKVHRGEREVLKVKFWGAGNIRDRPKKGGSTN